MLVLQNCVDLRKQEPGLSSEICHALSGDCHQVIGIKVEEGISIKEGDVPEPISFPKIKTESEVSCMSVCPLLCISYI
jgi:hypothetical protein